MAQEHIKSVLGAANTQTCLNSELRESMRVVARMASDYETAKKDAFLLGIFAALQILHIQGAEVAAKDIVLGNTDLRELSAYAKKHGGEVESDTVKWLKKSVLV